MKTYPLNRKCLVCGDCHDVQWRGHGRPPVRHECPRCGKTTRHGDYYEKMEGTA